uniref:BSD domain-containing protein n=1 Tax=Plectus sambesii TaxID=2011161 RepID=A0A914XF37_9BILA
MAMMQNVSSWFGNVSKQVTNLVYIQSPEVDDAIRAQEAEAAAGVDNMASQESATMEQPMKKEEGEKKEEKEQKKAEEGVKEEASATENATHELAGIDLDDVSRKAMDAAKSLGSSIFSFAKEATKTATKTATDTAKSLKTTADKTLLGDFQSEQQKFADELERKKMASQTAVAAVAPWIGYQEEALMKKQILTLSLDSRNFLRDPPGGIQFNFDFEQMNAVAMATLEEDPNLRKMRFQLVPKQVAEERFWRNYFYRVSLIKQSANLSSMSRETEVEKRAEQASTSSADQMAIGQPLLDTKDADESAVVGSPISPSADFLSDAEAPYVSEEELARVREQLGIAASKANQSGDGGGEQWEKEILADLNDYELVTQQTGKSEEEWEDEISKLLETEDIPEKEEAKADEPE